MIHIDRNRIPIPTALDPVANPDLAKEQEMAEAYFRAPEALREQRRFRFESSWNHGVVREALLELFHGKCAYCESKMENVEGLDVAHFRPESSVLESSDHPGYWWLVNEWDNLLVECRACYLQKANRFPLREEDQRVSTPKTSLSQEVPLLLDPCHDQPEDHFTYNDDGMIMSATDEGKTTITVVGLNRMPLVYRRQEVINELKSMVDFLLERSESSEGLNSAPAKNALQALKDKVREEEEFAGLKRQYILRALERIDKEMAESKALERTRRYTKQQKKEIRQDYNAYQATVRQVKLEDAEVESAERSITYTLQERRVEKIELTNVRTFEQQTFKFAEPEGLAAPWLMLLGENGTGKSTILKSLCMNLCDAEYFQNLVRSGLVNPNSFIRHGKRKAVIKVWITGSENPRVLEIKKDQVTFTNSEGEKTVLELPLSEENQITSGWSSDTYLLAFGATRLLPRGSEYEAKHIEGRFSRLDNLFNPFVPLVDAEEWLLGLDRVLFRRVAIILKDLLRMAEDEAIPVPKKEVVVPLNGMLVPIKELSDGYQSVIALTIDILQLVMTRWKNPDEARGIVLLDEVGAHLHPRWKMQIVGSLRKALPHIQFIVSTHQPLCLRGINKGEIVLMRRDADRSIEVITALPNPKELRISQLLTSVFGLSSTIDPELEAEYNRYYELRAQHERTAEEEQEMKHLQDELNPEMLLGETLLDNQVYSIVKKKYDNYRQEKEQDDLQQLTDETLSAVQDLWES